MGLLTTTGGARESIEDMTMGGTPGGSGSGCGVELVVLPSRSAGRGDACLDCNGPVTYRFVSLSDVLLGFVGDLQDAPMPVSAFTVHPDFLMPLCLSGRYLSLWDSTLVEATAVAAAAEADKCRVLLSLLNLDSLVPL